MAARKTPLNQPVVEDTDELLVKAEIHQPKSEAPAPEAPIVPKPFVGKGRNPFANDPAYQKTRYVFLPAPRAGESQNLFIRLNDVSWMIPKGKPELLPVPVAEQCDRLMEAERRETAMHNQMQDGMSAANFGMGYRMGEEPV